MTGNLTYYEPAFPSATWMLPQMHACLRRDEALVKALSAIGMPVASGPAAVHRILLQRKQSQAALLSPSYLRDFIRSHAAQAESAVMLKRSHAAALLSYCLQDIDDSDAESCSALKGEDPAH